MATEKISELEWEQRHTQALRETAESLQAGRATAQLLSMQAEQLGRSERIVDETHATVALASRVLRGMTWSGWIYNKVLAAPQLSTCKELDEIAMGFICPECKIKFLSADQLEAHYTKTHSSFASIKRESDRLVTQQSRSSQETQQSTTHTRDIHATFLSDLAPQLAELKDQSLALSDALDLHHMGLDRLDTKVGQVHHDMKQVERQAHKIMGRTIPAVFRFRCAIQEATMDKFLCTKNGDAVLSDVTKMASSADVVADGCTFRAYTLGDDSDVWGFQCEKTSRFVGINRYGNLKVQGVEFHSYEQFLVEAKSTTTIFCLSSYFGLGGWIAMKDLGTTSKLTIIRGTPENKAFAAQFRIVPV